MKLQLCRIPRVEKLNVKNSDLSLVVFPPIYGNVKVIPPMDAMSS